MKSVWMSASSWCSPCSSIWAHSACHVNKCWIQPYSNCSFTLQLQFSFIFSSIHGFLLLYLCGYNKVICWFSTFFEPLNMSHSHYWCAMLEFCVWCSRCGLWSEKPATETDTDQGCNTEKTPLPLCAVLLIRNPPQAALNPQQERQIVLFYSSACIWDVKQLRVKGRVSRPPIVAGGLLLETFPAAILSSYRRKN